MGASHEQLARRSGFFSSFFLSQEGQLAGGVPIVPRQRKKKKTGGDCCGLQAGHRPALLACCWLTPGPFHPSPLSLSRQGENRPSTSTTAARLPSSFSPLLGFLSSTSVQRASTPKNALKKSTKNQPRPQLSVFLFPHPNTRIRRLFRRRESDKQARASPKSGKRPLSPSSPLLLGGVSSHSL